MMEIDGSVESKKSRKKLGARFITPDYYVDVILVFKTSWSIFLKYDHSNWTWVDLNFILTCVQLSYNEDTKVYTLDTNHVLSLTMEYLSNSKSLDAHVILFSFSVHVCFILEILFPIAVVFFVWVFIGMCKVIN